MRGLGWIRWFLPVALLLSWMLIRPPITEAQGPTPSRAYPEARADGCVWYVALWSDGLYTSVPWSCPGGAKALRRSGSNVVEVAHTYPERDREGYVWYVALWADGVYTKVPFHPSDVLQRTPGPASVFGPAIVRMYPERRADGSVVEVHQWSDGLFTVRVIPCILPDSAVTFRFTVAADGSAFGQGEARNTCDVPIGMMVDVVAERDGKPLIDAPTIFIDEIPPRASTAITTRIAAAAQASNFRTTWSYLSGQERSSYCLEVGTTRCLQIDPRLVSTARQLETLERGQWLLKVAAENGVRVLRRLTPIGILGLYTLSTNTAIIDARLDVFSSMVRAAILAHELQHAADDAAGLAPETAAACFQVEADAFRRQAEVWSQFWQNDLPPDIDPLHAELNNITRTVAHDPTGFAASLVPIYSHECSG
ncbi:MAG: hypothetical protein HY677_05505 [Chloroflexi bacterium]|nr:hypothetical protein [Chloroflexota bacterium]